MSQRWSKSRNPDSVGNELRDLAANRMRDLLGNRIRDLVGDPNPDGSELRDLAANRIRALLGNRIRDLVGNSNPDDNELLDLAANRILDLFDDRIRDLVGNPKADGNELRDLAAHRIRDLVGNPNPDDNELLDLAANRILDLFDNRIRDLVGNPDPNGSPDSQVTDQVKQWKMIGMTMPELRKDIIILYRSVEHLQGKCVINVQNASQKPLDLEDGDIRILIGLQRQFCQECYDLMRACQYASSIGDVPEDLKNFSRRGSIPGRLWTHGIHAFIILLMSLPKQDYLHAYIILAYQLLALCIESVDDHIDVWQECMGDLARFRMAVATKSGNELDRELWHDIADVWYAKASMMRPWVGRILHHRAILARRSPWPQFIFYTRALLVSEPFDIARTSINQTLFATSQDAAYIDYIDDHRDNPKVQVECHFMIMHAFQMNLPKNRKIQASWEKFQQFLLQYIESVSSKPGNVFSIQGEAMAHAAILSMFNYNKPEHDGSQPTLRKVFKADYQPNEKDAADYKIDKFSPWYKAMHTLSVIASLPSNIDCYAHVHIMVAFIYCLATAPSGVGLLYLSPSEVPWHTLANFMNEVLRQPWKRTPQMPQIASVAKLQSDEFIHEQPQEEHHLPEDKNIRGAVWTKALKEYLPNEFFKNASSPEGEIQSEAQHNPVLRAERILWLGFQLAKLGLGEGREREAVYLQRRRWLRWNESSREFTL